MPRGAGASHPPSAPAQPHLPGLAASPARICCHPQPPAARFLGQESELAHSTANEGPQVDGRGLEHDAAASQQQEKHSAQDLVVELHTEAEGREAEGWESQHSPSTNVQAQLKLGLPFLPSDMLLPILILHKRRWTDVRTKGHLPLHPEVESLSEKACNRIHQLTDFPCRAVGFPGSDKATSQCLRPAEISILQVYLADNLSYHPTWVALSLH